MPFISFVIPCYCSKNTLPKVCDEVYRAMSELDGYTYEIILVNDSSPDDTFDTIRALCESHNNITGINLAKNFGQHSAIMAGLRHSLGDIIICLDDDGQTPATEVNKILDKLNEGYDAVYAKYVNKQHSAFRNLGSMVNERMTRIMLGKPKELYISSYFAVRRFIVEDMLRYEFSYPYVIGLVLRATKNIANVEVTHRARVDGRSGYTLYKLLSLWMNGFTAFSIVPLRIATILGMLFAASGFGYGLFTVIKKMINPAVPMGYSSTVALTAFIGGITMLMLGILGEYLGRIYLSINRSPQYVVREVVKKTDSTKVN